MRYLVALFLILNSNISFSQSNWKKDTSHVYSFDDSSNVWRKGNVAVSHFFKNSGNYKFAITDKYKTINNSGLYVSLNEPIGDTINVSLAQNVNEAHNAFVASHHLNFKTGMYFPDVHTSTAEINLIRGAKDGNGFRDGGHLGKSSTLKVSGTFSKNNRNYRNTEFDLINLRFFTDPEAGNPAQIDNFYALRLEDFRGVNPGIIQNGWGIFIKPSILNNYFAGKLGIGTTNVTHKLTIDAVSNPLKIGGLETQTEPEEVLTVNVTGEVKKTKLADFRHTFLVTNNSTILSDLYEVYIHKGGDVTYTLPLASTRTGKVWKISNIGTGSITISPGFYDGNELRTTIVNKSGASSFQIISDGTDYISIK
jgi:hypothetical protein